MNLPRRTFLHLAAGAGALPILPRVAAALDYPTRPVRIVVGYPAGGVGDILARICGQSLSEQFSQQFIVENRPGASTNIAVETVVRSAPDGYTLLWITSANAINAALYDNLNFNFSRDIEPVAIIGTVPGVMEVNPAVPAKTVPEFIAYAKANPGKINFASGGNGVLSHVAGELFKMMAGIDMVHVPYRGAAPAITDLIGGRVQVIFIPVTSSIEHIKAGRLRALGVTSATRLGVLPDVPPVADFLPGYQANDFQGIGVPKNTPVDIVGKLNRAVGAGLADPRIKERLMDLGSVLTPMSPVDFGKFIAAETEKWAKVIKFADIKPE